MEKNNHHYIVSVDDELWRSRLEPLPGCNTEVLRIYRLSQKERKLFRVERYNPGVIAVLA